MPKSKKVVAAEIKARKDKLDVLGALHGAWDAKTIGRWSNAQALHEAAVRGGAEGTDDTGYYNGAWFEEHHGYLIASLADKQQKKLRAAIELLMDEVNSSSGEHDFLVTEIGNQHRYILNEFVGLVMRAVQNGSLQSAGRDYAGETDSFGYAVRQAARDAYHGEHNATLAAAGFTEDLWATAVEDGTRLYDPQGAKFDGRISQVMGRFARLFYPPKRAR